MTTNRRTLVLLLVLTILVEPPLVTLGKPATPAPANDIVPGLVIVVEGIGGLDLVGKSTDLSLKHAGLPHEVHHFHWTHGKGKFLTDLQDTQHILKKAEELAKFIAEYRAKHPNRPIYIIAKSAGTGLTLYTLQLLPENTVERVVLLSPAVSPTFDLRNALRATRREVVSFHSRNDRLVLGWGTSKFGTVDRFYGQSAGLNGFVVPETLNEQDRPLFMRLIQVPFTSRMLREGVGTGSHHSTSMPWFLASEVVPWLR